MLPLFDLLGFLSETLLENVKIYLMNAISICACCQERNASFFSMIGDQKGDS